MYVYIYRVCVRMCVFAVQTRETGGRCLVEGSGGSRGSGGEWRGVEGV